MRRAGLRWALLALPFLSACVPEPVGPGPLSPPPPVAARRPAEAELPPIDRLWRGAEYQAASGALAARLAWDPASLPRRSSLEFARLVDPENLAFATDPRVDIQQRGVTLLGISPHVAQALRVYLAALTQRVPVEEEVLALTAFVLRLTRLQWELTDEMIPGWEMNGARLSGLAQMARGTAEQIGGTIVSLGGHDPAAVAGFVAASRDDFAAILRRLPYGTRTASLKNLLTARDKAADPVRRRAFADLVAAVEHPSTRDLTVTRAAIFGRDPARPVVVLPADLSSGADARDKRSGATDLYIVPLAQEAAAAPAMATRHRAAIDFDPATPYRVMIEVLFTLGQSEVQVYELRRLDDPTRSLFVSPPRLERASPEAARRRLGLTAFLLADGISLKTMVGNIAPGCAGVGAGLTFRRGADGRIPTGPLEACLRQIKATAPDEGEITVTASPALGAGEILDLVDVMRGGEDELFPIVRFGVAR
jgi:hypothetical protein